MGEQLKELIKNLSKVIKFMYVCYIIINYFVCLEKSYINFVNFEDLSQLLNLSDNYLI